MLARLARIAGTLLVVIASFMVYSLVVTPWIAPIAQGSDEPAEQPDTAREQRALEALRPYFPPDAWELQNPIIVEHPQFKLLVGNYQSLPNGIVKLQRCTVLFFPDGQQVTSQLPARVLIMQAPEGAMLRFEGDVDLSRAQTGKLQGGRLVGQVTIRGNLGAGQSPNDAGAQELLITTRDVDLQQDRIWTPNQVDFRLGNNHGSGRELQIAFTSDSTSDATDRQLGIQAVQSLRLLKDVRLHVELDSQGLLPTKEDIASDRGRAPQREQPQPPLEIRCDGAFHFDVQELVARFEDHVDVLRLRSEGPSEQLSCELLTIHFARGDVSAKEDSPPGTSAKQPTPELQVTKIEARGNPVTANSPAVAGHARGDLLEYDVANRRLILAGEQGVELRYEDSQIQANRIDYSAIEDSSLGNVVAAGPGQLETVLPGDKPQTLRASWQTELRVQPHEGKQLISLIGAARVQSIDVGELTANELWMWLEEPPENTGAFPTQSASAKKLSPYAMLARGNVRFDGKPVSGTTEQIEIVFEPTAARPARAQSTTTDVLSASAGARNSSQQDRYHLEGRKVQIRLGMPPDGQAMLQEATVAGDVRVTQVAGGLPQEAPLAITGQRLQLLAVESGRATISIAGEPAQAQGRGLSLTGRNIVVDQGSNQVRVDGAGRMTLPLERDLQGEELPTPQPINVSWEGRMNFDGQTIRFERSVAAQTAEQQLQADQLAVTLTRRVDFGQPVDQNQMGVSRIQCAGGVMLTSTTLDKGRRASWDRIQVNDLVIDQVSGNVRSDGPGWIASVRQGSAVQAAGGAALNPPGGPATASQLVFLKIQFQRGVTGNLNDKELVFSDQVRCIYGPISDWNAQLNIDKPGGPTGQEVMLSCQRLLVRQMGGTARQRIMELEALGNATVEGELFTAQSYRLTYTTGKELLVLEGTGQSDALISYQRRAGEPVTQTAAQKILYWRTTGHVQAQGIRFGTGSFGGN